MVCSQLKHPHIVPLCGVYFDGRDYPCLVMPYYADGDLDCYLNRTQARANILELVHEAVSGLEYMHNFSPYPIIHGDIKGQNMFVDNGHIRVADFGASKLPEIPLPTSSCTPGTLRWMSPELHCDENHKPTTASDVWAFGMTILQVFTGRNPYDHIKNNSATVMEVVKGKLPPQPPEIDGVMWTLLKRCFSYDPTRRPRMEAVSIVLNIMISEQLTPKDVNDLMDYISMNPLRHQFPTSCKFPCYWPGCGVPFDTLVTRRGHLVWHWRWWVGIRRQVVPHFSSYP
ncbi:kinase-like protein [Macrolepiota fuliginosa MF-IS2]|uniref:Kinase-like protein n=1 Tax=Macrolepiota fuliginosa MF-IS2 TaxID=1400762 RepID=A0A9P6C0F1_9AGAR|nr:kinase-like protein [Macrolepiota fuliginosa MF-IS2]